MTTTTVYLLKSFGTNEIGGNSAGVVLDAEKLTNKQKKNIAKKINFSETAFVEKSDKADFKVSFFSPTEEVDLCGHATIAVYSLLFQNFLLKPGFYKQELKNDILEIEIKNDGLVIMEQSLPQFSEFIDQDIIKDIFGEYLIVDNLKPQIVSTGLRDIMLPVATREKLFSLKPDFKKMAILNKKTNSIGIHAFTLDTINTKSTAHCRNFAPLYGITEESATGSSNGALACFLYNQGKLNDQDLKNMKFEQGYFMNEPSEILVGLEINKQKITKVTVGGKAILFGKKEIEI